MTENRRAIELIKGQLKSSTIVVVRGPGDAIPEALAKLVLHHDPDCNNINRILMFDWGITDDGATTLGEAIPSLPTLKQWDICYANKMGRAGAIAIAEGASKCGLLESFHSTVNKWIGSQVIKAFASHTPPSLKILRLSMTNIRDQEMQYVATLLGKSKTLQVLDLGWNEISDTSPIADALSINSTLVTLDLRDNRIDDSGIRGLAKALFHNTQLETIRLYNNRLTENGASCLKIALSHNRTVKDLFIDGNETSREMSNNIRHWGNNLQERCGPMRQRLSKVLLQFLDYPTGKPAKQSRSYAHHHPPLVWHDTGTKRQRTLQS